MRLWSVLLLWLLLSSTVAVAVAQDDSPPPTPPNTVQKGSAKKSMESANKFTEEWKKKSKEIDYSGAWNKFKNVFKKGVDIMEAVSNKDFNLDGKIEGRKSPLTEEQKRAKWKQEHEAKRAEHERKRKEYETDKATREESSPASPLSKQEREVLFKIRALMAKQFGNDQEQMFNHYDADDTQSLSVGEVRQVVKDAGLGSILTYGTYASKLVAKLDTDKDSQVQLSEILQVVGSNPSGKSPKTVEPSLKPPARRVTLDDLREACPDEVKVCEEHENCREELQLSLAGKLPSSTPRSDELKTVVKCYAGRGVPASKTEL